ncbi:hypothetical protein LGT39_09915 [Demequina sp. TTPB684]|uniref:hypothetical protein n=1 Tax=unclassified Demequina TaxID=2620311 RepID=UPI001CF29523|nr:MULTISPECIES: hypothetical protein [unclassified Demequina]MCB2413157.1 hypothetical protein [Demequina sp. TTPB684]UPU89663.1 hypothetical protein LGT36_006975 [Demequina sp. TMPB413]
MVDLWFAGVVGAEPSRTGTALYTQSPDGLFAVLVRGPSSPDSREESSQLLSHYGANVEGLGYLLSLVPVPLSPALERWSTARDVPAADIGGGEPVLISIDGAAQLALSWRFDFLRAYATTYRGDQIAFIAPAQFERIELTQTPAPTAPSEGPMSA